LGCHEGLASNRQALVLASLAQRAAPQLAVADLDELRG
jgi:hypothetical protein